MQRCRLEDLLMNETPPATGLLSVPEMTREIQTNHFDSNI